MAAKKAKKATRKAAKRSCTPHTVCRCTKRGKGGRRVFAGGNCKRGTKGARCFPVCKRTR